MYIYRVLKKITDFIAYYWYCTYNANSPCNRSEFNENLSTNYTSVLTLRFGGKWLFGGGVLCTAILSLLTPIAARTSFSLLIAVRVLEGVIQVNSVR